MLGQRLGGRALGITQAFRSQSRLPSSHHLAAPHLKSQNLQFEELGEKHSSSLFPLAAQDSLPGLSLLLQPRALTTHPGSCLFRTPVLQNQHR